MVAATTCFRPSPAYRHCAADRSVRVANVPPVAWPANSLACGADMLPVATRPLAANRACMAKKHQCFLMKHTVVGQARSTLWWDLYNDHPVSF